MEAVALNIKPNVALDPIGAAQQGIKLGQMGLDVQRLRQTIQTEAIAQQEATRALGMRQYEDSARKQMADILSRHTKTDPTGKRAVDHRAALAEARELKIDPTYTTELEGKLYSNETAGLSNATARTDYIKKTLDELSPQIRYMDEGQAANFLQGRAKLLAQATGLPIEQIGQVVGDHFNLGKGGSIVKTAQMFSDAAIGAQQERENLTSGISRDDVNPTGATSTAAREWLRGQGISAPANMNLAQLRQHPQFGPQLRLWEQQQASNIPSEGTRVEGIKEATEAGVARQLYTDAAAFEGDLKKVIGTKLGSVAEEAFNNWVAQDPKRALLQSAIDDYNTRNKTDISVSQNGIEAVFARLRGEERRLRTRQESGARIASTTNLSGTGDTKIPAETQRARDGDSVAVMRNEYDQEVEKLKAATTPEQKRRIEANIDGIARELKRMKVDVPGGADVSRNKGAVPDKVKVRNKASGTVGYLSRADAERAVASGKWEKM